MITKKNFLTGLGIATGIGLFDFLFKGEINMIRFAIMTLLGTFFISLFNRFKGGDNK